MEFMHYYQGILDLLSADGLKALERYHRKGRVGYDLPVILGT
jgi:hypothetical protein